MRFARQTLPAVALAALLLAGAGEAQAFDLGKTGSTILRAFGRKPADPPPRVRPGEAATPAAPAAEAAAAQEAAAKAAAAGTGLEPAGTTTAAPGSAAPRPQVVPPGGSGPAAAGGPVGGARAGARVAAAPNGAYTGRAAVADTALVPPTVLEEILLTPEPYFYESIGRRDPFVSLVEDEYLAEHEEENYELSEFVVRGILWGEQDRFVLLERVDGSSFILREGERLGSYTVSRIEPDAVLMYISEFGVGRTERLGLAERKGSRNARNHR